MTNVYIDGVDKTSTVSGSLASWTNKKAIKFTSKARTIAVFGRDYEGGCKSGGFAMHCTSTNEYWNDLKTDQSWKVTGSSDVETDVNKVCPTDWASPEYRICKHDRTWENAVFGSTNNADNIVGVPDICGQGTSWCFRKTVGRKTNYYFHL